METLKMVLSFVQQISWPMLAFFMLYYFAQPLRKLLFSFNEAIHERGIKLTTSGVEIPGANQDTPEKIDVLYLNRHYKDILTQNQPETLQEPLIAQKDSADRVLHQHEKNLVREITQSIQDFLKDNTSESSKDSVLESLLCDAYICLYFERAFERILGSQLQFLIKLQQQTNSFLSKEEALDIFQISSATVRHSSFERWADYLVMSGFIYSHGRGFRLTNIGQEFLRYINERHYPLQKAG